MFKCLALSTLVVFLACASTRAQQPSQAGTLASQKIAAGGATLAIDSQESGGTAHRTTTTTLSWTFTNTAGTLLVCGFVLTHSAAAASVTSGPTYNSVSMGTQDVSVNWDGTNSLGRIYHLVSPATGANTVSITGTNVEAILGGCISFTNQNATPIGGTSSGSGTVGATTATAGALTVASGNYLFACGGWGSGTGGTAGTGFTTTALINGSGNTGGDDFLAEYKLSTGGSTTPTFTWTGSDLWGIVVVEVK